MSAGVLGTTEFAGWNSQAEATRLVKIAFDDFLGKSSRGILWLRANDISPLAKRVLLGMSAIEGGTLCVMGDINERLPQGVLEVLDGLMPAQVCSMAEQLSCKLLSKASLVS